MPKRITTSEKFERLLNRAGDQLPARMVTVMNKVAPLVRNYIREVYMGAPQTLPRRLARNTGNMERHTVVIRAKPESGGTSAGVHINVPYASTHFTHTGRKELTIRPKTKAALTVPILVGANKRPPLPATGYKARFAFNGILYAKIAKRGILPIFALRSSVTVPTRIDVQRDIQPYAELAMKDYTEREIERLFG